MGRKNEHFDKMLRVPVWGLFLLPPPSLSLRGKAADCVPGSGQLDPITSSMTSAFGSRQRREFRQSSGTSFTKVAVLYTSVKESRKVKLRRNIGVKMAGSPHCVAWIRFILSLLLLVASSGQVLQFKLSDIGEVTVIKTISLEVYYNHSHSRGISTLLGLLFSQSLQTHRIYVRFSSCLCGSSAFIRNASLQHWRECSVKLESPCSLCLPYVRSWSNFSSTA